MPQAVAPGSIQPDDRIRVILARLQMLSLTAILSFGSLILAGWTIPAIGALLPHFLMLMRANTALLIVLSAASLFLGRSRSSHLCLRLSTGLALFSCIVAALILLKDFSLISLHIETVLAADSASLFPGKVSPEAALSFLLLGLVLIGLRARKSVLSFLIDATTLLLFLAMLIFLARYCFGLSHLFVLFQSNPFSLQTLISLLLLTAVAGTRRAEYGLFAILLDAGPGGMIARLATPVAVLLPFLIAVPKALLVRVNPATESSSTAVATSLLSISAVCLVLVLAWRTKSYEATVRELSLRDELTGLYNRRGFYVLAEQAFEISRRSHESFTIIFIDMDHLKQVNDTLGHEAGSSMLKEMAGILRDTFRKTDVVGRIGGDEYVVAGRSNDPEMNVALSRLENTVVEVNDAPGRAYVLSFSMGVVTCDGDTSSSLEELVARADASMYEDKRRKRSTRDSPAVVLTA